jgi:restriction system protein
MAFWGVRAGASGEREAYALANDCVLIGFPELPDLAVFPDRLAVASHIGRAAPQMPAPAATTWSTQIWAFAQQMRPGDLVALPRRGTGTVALGEITGDYRHDPQAVPMARHGRSVRWLHREFPVSGLDVDIAFSLKSQAAVFCIRRENGEARMRARLLAAPVRLVRLPGMPPLRGLPGLPISESPPLEVQVRAAIRRRIGQRFRGRLMEALVAAVLEARGYVTVQATGGHDGGVDIVAGMGPFGLEAPRLAVQVKSSDQPVPVQLLRYFEAQIGRFGAETGLFVAWGGFAGETCISPMRDFFKLRLWDADALLDEVLAVYEKLPEAIRADLRLKQVWMPVLDEADA